MLKRNYLFNLSCQATQGLKGLSEMSVWHLLDNRLFGREAKGETLISRESFLSTKKMQKITAGSLKIAKNLS